MWKVKIESEACFYIETRIKLIYKLLNVIIEYKIKEDKLLIIKTKNLEKFLMFFGIKVLSKFFCKNAVKIFILINWNKLLKKI